jgi:hypothetical protein
MMDRENDRIVALQASAAAETKRSEDLPFAIELWDVQNTMVERVIARASNPQLARAIFGSAQKKYPERRITVPRGAETLLDSPQG